MKILGFILSIFLLNCSIPAFSATEDPNQSDSSPEAVSAAVEAVPAIVIAPEVTPIAPDLAFVPDQSIPGIAPQGAYNYGDYKSETLTIKAWKALDDRDLNAVLAYTNKCISFYAREAAKMQKSMSGYATGDARNVFAFWAINDVATCLYIQGEALRRTGRMDEAKAAFDRIVNEFYYAQTYDLKSKAFWKPVDGAKDSLFMIDNNLDLHYGDMNSNFLVQQMWQALHDKNTPAVIGYDMKLEHLYGQQALDMNRSLTAYAEMPAQNIYNYWALNDVATGMFIVGEAYRLESKYDDALKAYNKVVSDYLYAQCWDPQGWFWRPAEVAQQKIAEVQAAKS